MCQHECQLNSKKSNIVISTQTFEIRSWLLTTVVQNMTALFQVITLNYTGLPKPTWNVNLD
jgi:hypothetical protein